jgi:hypothetical protein
MKSFDKFLREKKEAISMDAIDAMVSSLDPTDATAVLESTVAIIALYGDSFKLSAIESIDELGKIAHDFYKAFLKANTDKAAQNALKQWILHIGGATKQLGKMKDIILNNISRDYYKHAPTSFEVPTADKDNTADIVLIKKGTKEKLINELGFLKDISTKAQKKYVQVDTKTGLITLLNMKLKVAVEFYQVSLKKGQVGTAGGGRVGKVTSFALNRFLGGQAISQPTKSATVAGQFEQVDLGQYDDLENLDEGLLDFFDKGLKFIKDVSSKALDAVSKGIGAFLSWARKQFSSIVNSVKNRFVSIGNSEMKSDAALNAASSLFTSIGLREEKDYDAFLNNTLMEGKQNITIKAGDVKQLATIRDQFIGKKVLNKIMVSNKKRISKLNKDFSVRTKKDADPITFLGSLKQSKLDEKTAERIFKKIDRLIGKGKKAKAGAVISREDFSEILKISMNYSASLMIKGILISIEKDMVNYQDLTDALLAMSASFVGEAKFGNTALPLVIIFGGKKQTMKVLGTRSAFEKKQVKGIKKNIDNLASFPIAVLRFNRVSGKSYNTVGFLLLANYVAEDDKAPIPEWIVFSMQTSSGSSFSFKVEGETYTKNWRGRG